MIGQEERYGCRYASGDINLVSALMACGVYLDQDCPVTLVESETIGKDYASFRLMATSADGIENTGRLMSAWSGVEPLPAEHPFSVICNFSRNRPREIRNSVDLMDYAMDWLRERGINPPVALLCDIPALCEKLPQAVESYILSFAYNRETCFQLIKQARREVHQRSNDGLRNSLIDRRLPKWQRDELLSRLQG